jgi:hypothetical protein
MLSIYIFGQIRFCKIKTSVKMKRHRFNSCQHVQFIIIVSIEIIRRVGIGIIRRVGINARGKWPAH